jgi:uncharacterized membrane protein
VDRVEIARSVRRRQVAQALVEVATREQALAAQLEELVAEADGATVDERVFALLEPGDADEVRAALELDYEPPSYTAEEIGVVELDEDPADSIEDEILRLQEEIEACRRRRASLDRYRAALGADDGAG